MQENVGVFPRTREITHDTSRSRLKGYTPRVRRRSRHIGSAKLRKSPLRIDGSLNADYRENHVDTNEREILCNALIISEGSARHCVTAANGNVAPTQTVTVRAGDPRHLTNFQYAMSKNSQIHITVETFALFLSLFLEISPGKY